MFRLWMLATLMLVANAAHAEGVLAVAPLRVLLSDGKTSEILSLTNRADKTRTYKIVLKDQVMDAKGDVIERDTFDYSAKRMLRFMPGRITLAPGQRQNIRVMATIPEGLPDGDYHTHMIFEQQRDTEASTEHVEQGFKLQLGSIYSIGIPVIVRHGKIESNLKLTSARLEKHPDKQGTYIAQVGFERSGNAEAGATLHILDATTGAMLAQPRNVRMYREVNAMTLPIHLSPAADAGNKKLLARLLNGKQVLGEVPVEP